MANRYQDETFPADSDRAGQGASARESDPLAELARLIGQTDPFSNSGRANPQPVARPAEPAWLPEAGADDHDAPAAAPLPWMQHRATHPVAAEPGEREFVHPVRRYAASQRAADHLAPPAVNPDSDDQRGYDQQAYDQGPHSPDHAERYDDALYGQMPGDPAHPTSDGGYPDDSYAYQDGYEEEIADGRLPSSRRGGLMTVVAVLALAVIGTGGAFAYRTYVGSSRSGEPPVIKADTAPTKLVPAPSTDAAAKPIQDRLATGNAEQLVSREEQPVDVKDNTKAGPRVVFPPLATNGSPPSAASVAIVAPPPSQAAPVAPAGDEPRKIKTYTVRPDQPDGAAAPAARTARASVPARNAPAVAAPAGNAPLSLSPQAGNAGVATRVASNNPTQPVATSGAGGYVVQISSQRNEADAKASFRAMQGKFPSVLGSRSPLIKRADLGPKGVYYRAMVGPFGSPEDATQFCGSLKTAGGQCVVQRN